VTNLIAVSECKDLAPWITKPTVVCNETLDRYPMASGDDIPSLSRSNMIENAYQELLRIKRDEATWSPDIWARWPGDQLDTASGHVPINPQQQDAIQSFQKVMVVSDMRAIGELEGYWRAQEQLLGTLRTAQDSGEIRQNTTTIHTIIATIKHFI
jgi:hypothetical protein